MAEGKVEFNCSVNSEEVRSVPEKLAKFKASKRYLQATELLKNSGKYKAWL